jgi:arylsulfatase A-like enzyme
MKDIREDDYPFIRDLYSAEVTFSDHCVGGLIENIKKLGLWENTIIAFSTDHGTHLGEQGCVQKQAKLLNSCLARVPFIIRHPDPAFRGKRVTELASHRDFVPTFLSLLGVKSNLSFHGGNAWELISGGKLRNHAVTGYGNFGAVHTHSWHYFQNVWGNDPGLGPQLYDLGKDPREEKNVVKSYPEVVAEMKKIMEESFRQKIT